MFRTFLPTPEVWPIARAVRRHSMTESLALADLMACSFERWYPRLRKHSIPSTVLPLTSDFVEYLKADGVAVAWGGARHFLRHRHRPRLRADRRCLRLRLGPGLHSVCLGPSLHSLRRAPVRA